MNYPELCHPASPSVSCQVSNIWIGHAVRRPPISSPRADQQAGRRFAATSVDSNQNERSRWPCVQASTGTSALGRGVARQLWPCPSVHGLGGSVPMEPPAASFSVPPFWAIPTIPSPAPACAVRKWMQLKQDSLPCFPVPVPRVKHGAWPGSKEPAEGSRGFRFWPLGSHSAFAVFVWDGQSIHGSCLGRSTKHPSACPTSTSASDKVAACPVPARLRSTSTAGSVREANLATNGRTGRRHSVCLHAMPSASNVICRKRCGLCVGGVI